MQIQPIANQPNFNGKFIFKEKAENLNRFTPDALWRNFNKVRALVSEKPYDIFIWENKDNTDFYNIAANKSFKEAEKVKEYTVKIKANALTESIVDAAEEAVRMYEKFIAKGVRN